MTCDISCHAIERLFLLFKFFEAKRPLCQSKSKLQKFASKEAQNQEVGWDVKKAFDLI